MAKDRNEDIPRNEESCCSLQTTLEGPQPCHHHWTAANTRFCQTVS